MRRKKELEETHCLSAILFGLEKKYKERNNTFSIDFFSLWFEKSQKGKKLRGKM